MQRTMREGHILLEALVASTLFIICNVYPRFPTLHSLPREDAVRKSRRNLIEADGEPGTWLRPDAGEAFVAVADAIVNEKVKVSEDYARLLSHGASTPVAGALAEATTNPFGVGWDNTLVICAVMKLEHVDDVREWLQYHRFLGVDHVLLYDNSGNRGASADALSDFIEAGYLTYTLLPGVSKQIPLYDHCAKVSARRWSWMAAIDLDEFIDVVDPKALVQQGSPLKAVLKDFRFRAGVMLPWLPFGPGDHDARPPGGPLKHYTQCMFGTKENTYGKTIANMHWVSAGSSAHSFWYRDNGVLVTDAQEPAPPLLDEQQQRLVDTPLFVPDTPTRRAGARLVLNHYITRSREDFSVKQHRGAGARSQTKGLYRSKAWFEDMKAAQVTDARCTHIQTFADACCQRDGKPWPPAPANPAPESGIDAATNAKAHVPRGRQKYPTLTHLPRVVELVPGHTRLPRDSEPIVGPNPFADEWHASVALCAHAPLDRPLPGPAALLQWVQHHRYAGVDTIILYTSQPTSPQEAAALITLQTLCQHSNGIAEMRTLPVNPTNPPDSADSADSTDSTDSAEPPAGNGPSAANAANGPTAADAANGLCIQELGATHAWVAFLSVQDYLMVQPSAEEVKANRLKSVLRESVYRYASGVVMPVYNFSAASDMPDDQTPLRGYDTCSRAPPATFRTLGNSHWLSRATNGAIAYKGGYLPVTDANEPWVRAAERWTIPGVSPAQRVTLSETPDLPYAWGQLPFGDVLSVFHFPSQGEELPAAQAPSLQDAAMCTYAVQATMRCCE